jgi:hypothetical protein
MVEGLEERAVPATTLLLSGLTSPITAGVAANLTVTAENADGSVDTGYTGTIALTSTDGQASLPANYTFVAGDGGVHSFSVTLKSAGTQALTASDTVTGTITGSEGGITVNPAAASTLLVSGFPATVTAGVAGNVTVTAEDAFGNTATGYTGTVHFTGTDAQASLPADYTFVAGDGGVHSFSVTLKSAGTQALTASDTVTGTISGSEGGISVNPAAASTLLVSGFPATVTAGTAGSVTVSAKDAFGNTATGYLGTVHFTSTDSQAANNTFVAGDAGVHL